MDLHGYTNFLVPLQAALRIVATSFFDIKAKKI